MLNIDLIAVPVESLSMTVIIVRFTCNIKFAVHEAKSFIHVVRLA